MFMDNGIYVGLRQKIMNLLLWWDYRTREINFLKNETITEQISKIGDNNIMTC